jgi:ribose/xylose/arabinose/galactoside ABC-type transport system permease subunit
MRRMPASTPLLPGEVTVEVPVQYFQSVIALETAVAGVLLFQIRFFATGNDASKDAPQESGVDPRLRVLLLIVLTATVFGSLEAIREGRGRWSAVLVTLGLAVSVLPILLRVLPPLQRDAQTQQRHPHYWVTVLGLVLYAVIVVLIVAHR